MRAKLIRIGNSQGVRIPKALIQEAALPSDVEIIAEGNRLVIAPARQPRQGWEEAFRKMHAEEERVIDGEIPTSFDEEEWEW